MMDLLRYNFICDLVGESNGFLDDKNKLRREKRA